LISLERVTQYPKNGLRLGGGLGCKLIRYCMLKRLNNVEPDMGWVVKYSRMYRVLFDMRKVFTYTAVHGDTLKELTCLRSTYVAV